MTEIYGKKKSDLNENEKVLFKKDKEIYEMAVEQFRLHRQLGQSPELLKKEVNREIFVGVTLLGLTVPTSTDENKIFLEKVEESVYGLCKNVYGVRK